MGPFCWCGNRPLPLQPVLARPPATPSGRTARLLNHKSMRIYVPLLMRPWIMQACHANASCHLRVDCALSMCLSDFIGGSAWESAHDGGFDIASSSKRASHLDRQRAGSYFRCPCRPALALRSALTTPPPPRSLPGGVPTFSVSPTVSAGAQTCTPFLRPNSRPRAPPTF